MFQFDFLIFRRMKFVVFQLDSLIGLTAEVSVRGVADKAGNKAQGTISWSFTVADFGASAASVHVTGLLLNVSASSLNNAVLTAIKAELATLLGVADTRFTNLEISDAWIGGVAMSALEFTISTSASKTATSLAQQLAETVQNLAAGSNALSSYSSALKTAVSSQVYQLKGLIVSFTIIVNLVCRCAWLWPLLPSRRTTRTLCTVAPVVQLDTLKMVGFVYVSHFLSYIVISVDSHRDQGSNPTTWLETCAIPGDQCDVFGIYDATPSPNQVCVQAYLLFKLALL
jgi:hypothetical protein